MAVTMKNQDKTHSEIVYEDTENFVNTKFEY